MKPTYQIKPKGRVSDPRATTKNRKSPATDWSFHSSAPVLHGHPGSVLTTAAGTRGPLNLWSLSQSFEAAEKQEFRAESLLLAFVSALAAWPIVYAFYMASETVR